MSNNIPRSDENLVYEEDPVCDKVNNITASVIFNETDLYSDLQKEWNIFKMIQTPAIENVNYDNTLLSLPQCHRYLPSILYNTLEEIVLNINIVPRQVSKNKLIICDKIYRQYYNNGGMIFNNCVPVPSLLECVLSFIIEDKDIERSIARAYVLASVSFDEVGHILKFSLPWTNTWERMCNIFPSPLLWELHTCCGGSSRKSHHKNIIIQDGIFSIFQRNFILSTV